jgi:predicted enzyme related to lactoylglutathione lyase
MADKPFAWYECYTRDKAASTKFYTELLGWGSQEHDMGDGMKYTMLTHNGEPFAGVFPMDGPQFDEVPPHWSIYANVDDVDASLAKATSMGANVLVQPMDIPNIGRMALIQDPQGATMWLYKAAAAG